ncbi:MAG: UDP-2,3-diacylglucosamine diphosphatase LpxI [Chloroflexi bacterium]|nr:UDP-2,3-diacylglucosamine diphosphatase LpxI [Chloroflexota bacterium]
MDSINVVGLIAGEGRLPFMIAEGARRAGAKVVCVGLDGSSEASLAKEVDVFYTVPLARPGNWIRKLKKHNVTSAVMAGRVAKGQIFTPWRILRYLPDWRAVRIWYWRLRVKNKQNETLLSALADELTSGGIILEDSTKYCKEHLATNGPMTGRGLSTSLAGDIEFGWPIVKKMAEMDIGQAIAVKEREVIAVEAIEGTAEMIERTGRLCRAGGWTLLKAAKAKQDMRFDVPCVGPDTIKSLAKNGAKCLVVEAGKTIIIDKPQTLALATEMGICVIGK